VGLGGGGSGDGMGVQTRGLERKVANSNQERFGSQAQQRPHDHSLNLGCP
jgi:hypothetical protein